MKGLLKKDFLMIGKHCRLLAAMCLIFAVVGGFAVDDTNFFFMVYPVLLGGIMPITLLSYDERAHWDLSCASLPISRATVVHERYLLCLLCFGVFFLLTLLSHALALLPKGRGAELGQLVGVLFLLGLTGPSLMLPICFRWGVEKARILYYVLIGGIVAAGMIFSAELMGRSALHTFGGMLLAPVITLLVFAVSWLLSVKLYQKREF